MFLVFLPLLVIFLKALKNFKRPWNAPLAPSSQPPSPSLLSIGGLSLVRRKTSPGNTPSPGMSRKTTGKPPIPMQNHGDFTKSKVFPKPTHRNKQMVLSWDSKTMLYPTELEKPFIKSCWKPMEKMPSGLSSSKRKLPRLLTCLVSGVRPICFTRRCTPGSESHDLVARFPFCECVLENNNSIYQAMTSNGLHSLKSTCATQTRFQKIKVPIKVQITRKFKSKSSNL